MVYNINIQIHRYKQQSKFEIKFKDVSQNKINIACMT